MESLSYKEAATNPSLPRAYLNYLIFDEGMKLVAEQSGAFQVADGSGSWNGIGMPDFLDIAQNGYLVVYLSNEQHVDVFFDDLKVTHVRGRLLEEQHYYPHGLLISKALAAGSAPENKYQFEGKKMQDEVGLKLYDFHARQYDPQIGRFWGIDPADQFPSGYTGIGNDPANLTDPTGMQAGGVAAAAPGMETSADAEARKKYVSRGAEKFQLYVDGQFAGLVNWENAPHVGTGVPAVALMQGVSFATRNVGGNVMHGYWMDANYTDYTRQGLANIDGKFTQMGEPVVFNKFIALGGN